MLPGKDRCFDLNMVIIQNVEVLDHDDGVGVFREHVTGVHVECVFIDVQPYGFGRVCPECGRGSDGNTIHGGGVEVGGGELGCHRPGQNPAH